MVHGFTTAPTQRLMLCRKSSSGINSSKSYVGINIPRYLPHLPRLYQFHLNLSLKVHWPLSITKLVRSVTRIRYWTHVKTVPKDSLSVTGTNNLYRPRYLDTNCATSSGRPSGYCVLCSKWKCHNDLLIVRWIMVVLHLMLIGYDTLEENTAW